MKLCLLAHGSSIHTQRWIRYLEDRGHELSLITFTPEIRSDKIRVYDLQPLRPVSYNSANWHYLLRLPKLRRFIGSIRPDIVCAHYLTSYGLMAALTRPGGCPLVTCIQGSDLLVFPERSSFHRSITRFALRHADLLILPAEHMQNDLFVLAGAGVSFLTLQYGIDIGRFHPVEPFGHLDKPVCVSNRAMVPRCGVETILEAAVILKSRRSALRFLLTDSGNRTVPFRKKAQALGLRDRVRFEERIDHEQMPAALRRAAIYISMVSPDGASLSLMEAMACGLFPVVADIPANREWVAEGVNGFLVPPGRPGILADTLQKAWDHREMRRAAVRVNWEQVQARCDFYKNMQTIETALRKLVSA